MTNDLPEVGELYINLNGKILLILSVSDEYWQKEDGFREVVVLYDDGSISERDFSTWISAGYWMKLCLTT